MSLPCMIALDGPAASGKSTLAEQLASFLGYLFFDTGVMYRAVTYAAITQLHGVSDEIKVSSLSQKVQIDVQSPSIQDGRKNDILLDGVDVTWQIRLPEVEAHVSQVSAYPLVRKAMTEQQRRIGLKGKVVMVGRDIGTVVLPEADLKIYLDASVEERAQRRYRELSARGDNTPYDEILISMKRRDQIDSTRAVAPLRPAQDAIIINTDGLSTQEVYQKMMEMVDRFSK